MRSRKPNPLTTWETLVYWAPFHDTCAALAQWREHDGVHLYAGYDASAPPARAIRPEREVELILSILNAYKQVPQPPWGVTMLGWHAYANHWSSEVREAVARHPYKFQEYCYCPSRPEAKAA